MKMSDFIIEYPPTLVYSEQIPDKNGINFVSSSGKNNGIVGRVKSNSKNKLYKKGSITVPLKGSVMMAFVQPEDFYVAHQIAVLTPKKLMSLQLKQYYCLCFRKNSYRFSYGRQADRSLKNIPLPNNIPEWVNKTFSVSAISKKSFSQNKIHLSERKWKTFRYDDKRLFKIERGRGVYKKDIVKVGKTLYITALDNNNGLTGKFDIVPEHQGNSISVNRDGNGVGEAFYQSTQFCSTEAVHVFVPQFKLNPFIAMFLISLIRMEKFKYNYGRKWGLDRMNKSIIKLPVDKNGNPDWQFMEDYIKSLSYSSNL